MRSGRFLGGLAITGLLCGLASSALAQTRTFTLTPDFDDVASTKLNNVQVKPDNQVVLGPTAVSKTRLVWVDNYVPGWIVRLDSTTGKQTARFDSALQFINGKATGARPSKENCNWANLGNCPGRVAVDTNGDVWIVNRAFGSQGTLSKFSGDINHCIDRNNNGIIETSRDANNDGIVNPNDGAEYFAQNDECILTTIPVGGINHCPRSVAVDKRGKIWVGTCCGGYQIFRYNPNEPVALEATLQMPAGSCMYSAAAGGDYVFFSNRAANSTIRVNIDTLQVQFAPCGAETYGVVADPGGGWAWLGGYSQAYIRKADFTTNPPSCQHINTPAMVTAMTLDLQNNVWASGYGNSQVYKFNPQGVWLGGYPAASGPHGLSVDFDGNIWSVHDGAPHVIKFSPSGTNLGAFSIGGPAGYDYTPYLYSDFTGVQVDRNAPYARVGFWEGVYDAGAPGVAWQTVSWNSEPQAAIPTETSLKISVRAADTLGELATAPYTATTNNGPLIGIKGRYVQVKSDLAGPGFATPVLSDVKVQGPCGVVGEACCIKDSDCSDGKPCTQDQCPVPGGSCIHPPTPDCCTTDFDCNDSNTCTVDACNGGTCQHIQQQGCCISNAECDDGEPCTADLCSALGGTCSNVSINGCCITNDDCTKGNPCSASTCPGPGQLCNIASKPGCCQTDDDCKEIPDDLCTTNTCDPGTNTCSQVDFPGCCNKDADCTDSDPCTTDQCSGLGGQCTFPLKANCCTPSSPQVGQDCELPVSPYDKPPCKPGKLVCNNNDLVCEGAVKSTPETCDWIDNNCDGFVDNASCPQGSTCINGVCAEPCGSPEFPCEPGFSCKGGVCLPIDCAKIICPPGQTCVSGDCVGGDGGVGGAAGAAGSAGSAGDGGLPDASAGSAGAAGAAGKAGASGAGASGGTAGASAAAGAAGTAGAPAQPHFDENFGQTTGGGGCRCQAPGTTSSWGSFGWAAALGLATAAVRRRRRDR